MLKLTRLCIDHRRLVVVTWVAVAIVTSVIAAAAGRNYATNFSLPGTQSQHALDLLQHNFKTQAGDVDTVVAHVSSGTIDAPAVHSAITRVLAQVVKDPHVVSVLSPYSQAGAVEVSKNRMTAFATVNYDERANNLPNATGKPVLNQIQAVHVPGLQLAAGGQVIEQAEGFSIGPATTVGVIAAMVILLLTFGSLLAAAMPLATAGLGLITGTALIGLATHITSMSN
ncbi:MAG TPA: MMPL family transporter, partial [Solirubrobacteraceae bacterium]